MKLIIYFLMLLSITSKQNILFAEHISENARLFLQDAWIWENNRLQKEKQFSLKNKTDVEKLTKKMHLASLVQDYKNKMNIIHDNEITLLKEHGTNTFFIMPKKILDTLVEKNAIKQYSLTDYQNNRPPPLPPRNNQNFSPAKPPRRRKTIDNIPHDTASQITENTYNNPSNQGAPQDDLAKQLQEGRTRLRSRPIKEKEKSDDKTLAQQLQDQQKQLRKTPERKPIDTKSASTKNPLINNLSETAKDFLKKLQKRRAAVTDDNDNTSQNNETNETWDTD